MVKQIELPAQNIRGTGFPQTAIQNSGQLPHRLERGHFDVVFAEVELLLEFSVAANRHGFELTVLIFFAEVGKSLGAVGLGRGDGR